jgi:hypothetical protein
MSACLCVYVGLYVVEPICFRVLGFSRCPRRCLSINKPLSQASDYFTDLDYEQHKEEFCQLLLCVSDV